MLHEFVCLTLPKKVVEINGANIVIEDHTGARQELKTIVILAIGDFVISQRGIITEKMDKKQAAEIFDMINTMGE